ncbi:MAG: M48 family metallopeptidase, partial [Acidimicrobiales bacterium]
RSARRKKTVSARLVKDTIEIRVPQGLSDEAESAHITNLVNRIERKQLAKTIDLRDRAAVLSRRYDLPLPTEIRWVANQNSRWGSCTAAQGSVRLSDRMTGFPDYVVDYVLLHELTHLVEPNHGERFKALMKRFPSAERAEGYLEAATRFR